MAKGDSGDLAVHDVRDRTAGARSMAKDPAAGAAAGDATTPARTVLDAVREHAARDVCRVALLDTDDGTDLPPSPEAPPAPAHDAAHAPPPASSPAAASAGAPHGMLVAAGAHAAGRAHDGHDGHDGGAGIGWGTAAGGLTFNRFAAVVPAAAAGLIRRGLRVGDVAAVHLDGARDLAPAVHAVIAAGGVPAVLPPAADAEELASMLTACGARLLLTSAALAPAALAAADASYVRQVVAFGDVPGATPFAELLSRGPAGDDADAALVDDVLADLDPLRDLALRTPAERFTHADRLADMYRVAGILAITEADVLVAHPPDCPGPTWLALIDLALTQGASVVAVRDPGPAALWTAADRAGATIVIAAPAKLRTAAGPLGSRALRVLTPAPVPAEVARACRARPGWTVTPLG